MPVTALQELIIGYLGHEWNLKLSASNIPGCDKIFGVKSLAFINDNELAIARYKKTEIIDLNGKSFVGNTVISGCLSQLNPFADEATALVSMNGKLYAGTRDGHILILDSQNKANISKIKVAKDSFKIDFIDYSPRLEVIIYGKNHEEVCMRDKYGNCYTIASKHHLLKSSPCGKYLAYSHGGILYIFNLELQKHESSFERGQCIWGIGWLSNGSLVCGGISDVSIWNIDDIKKPVLEKKYEHESLHTPNILTVNENTHFITVAKRVAEWDATGTLKQKIHLPLASDRWDTGFYEGAVSPHNTYIALARDSEVYVCENTARILSEIIKAKKAASSKIRKLLFN